MTSSPTHDSDVTFIRALAELLRDNDLTELSVRREFGENDSLDVTVSRQAPAPAPAAAPAPMLAPPPMAHAATPESAPAAQDPASHPGAVTSPMVGTAYLQPEPGSQPFVSVGTQVREGDTLLIIEAMKTMNQIPAPRSGTVKRVLIDDGSPVEYGATLMIIE
ncbi:acetyl-CoA carboxylase biotin carboxyl carrier protein [Histidinibacterium lentulum]|uniref:Biotin carboxyl carrier protein of acetyl-CoA carboxylase n=1 Tax=Histidinibacterium lentulum TaxID=2480588 RepID=A0A3N2QTT3_9RHOB|nr:acetyl-CoA carboxylase biotin carboxyl carrier protein [Histidinibacterium lentulum]ROT98624.1 acetyl-CoA carboxylase biotin carboxyl carrier protein [Histidinibacterium lentulum]